VRVGWDGTSRPLTGLTGWSLGRSAGGTDLLVTRSLESTATAYAVRSASGTVGITSYAETPAATPVVTILDAAATGIRTAVLFPTGHVPGSRRLPVLLSPYGGPHHQEVVAALGTYGESQWLADQGFCVVVADGRGTPGHGPAWDRSVHLDYATPVLEDQVTALAAVAERWPDDVDTARVGIRGWSFGGFLAALAVLRRPDVFHAAVAGAPVTDQRLYDTAYTERYLGDPTVDAGPYERCSLIADAPSLRRPLLIIHGLTDDNVVVAHTLRLSAALTVAGRPHQVLPLSGVTHMTPQEEVAENKLLLELDFLVRALAVAPEQ
jgi:dipeptidyl-peptidase-4